MTYSGKTTIELSEKDFSELSGLFNNVFNRKTDAEYFTHKYHSPYLGYSFHGLMYNDEGNIAGAVTIIPFSYSFFENQITAGCAVDLMIHENYRKDFLSFKHMYDHAIEKSGSSLDFLYAVPNPNAYLYWTKFLKWRDIGQLNYYIQVLNISKIKASFSGFDWMSKAFTFFMNNLVLKSDVLRTEQEYPIFRINDETYRKYRFNKNYAEITESDKYAYYIILNEMGIDAAYIVDLHPFTKSWAGSVVKQIYTLEKKHIDIIIYIGNNLKPPINLIKVPHKLEPRSLHLVGHSLSEKVDDRIYNMDNWLFNLSDFDAR